MAADPALAAGLATRGGRLFHAGVGAAHGLPVADPGMVLAA
jgi:alanine dehydrogenase